VKVLVANRGEIAVRLVRTCRELGLATAAVYSECDRTALHVRMADEAYPIGPNDPAASYLNIDRLVETARRAGADAIHPGYGFLAENPAFARACRDAGLTFIGPPAQAMALMGSKTAARAAAIGAGVPVVPGTETPLAPDLSDDRIGELAAKVGYPLLVKAVAGGGGKGMRNVGAPADLIDAVRAARSESGSAFGDTAVYFERQLSNARHVEVQVFGDRHGTVLPFVERECSIQRRHQKLVEESPSIAVTPDLRRNLADAAVRLASSVGYTNAGTLEFLVDGSGRFYFLEMNTRLQVEHPVTEMVTALDMVEWQIRIARGERLDVDPRRAMSPIGHAIECRIYAEDPDEGFLPSPGTVGTLRPAGGPGVRDDRGVEAGDTVPIYYDSLVSKLVVWGTDRTQAIARMRRALDEYQITGIRTTIPFFQWLAEQSQFVSGEFDTTTVDRLLAERGTEAFRRRGNDNPDLAAIAAGVYAFRRQASGGWNGPPRSGPAAANGSNWTRIGRLEALGRQPDLPRARRRGRAVPR
jgi:acetyl-CoA carboxylase biotin carboxylase subunit